MTVTEAVVKKLKIKISTKGVGNHSERDAQENVVKVIMNDAQRVNENKKPEMNIKLKFPVPANSNKRGPQVALDGKTEKKPRMDQSIKQQCGSILQVLMTHRHGWAFRHPVDPVAFNIPDYFEIITEPMDLGTVKSKLEDNLYFSVEEFAADIRLTFANSMKYNPSNNAFHTMAKELDCLFNRRWKLMEAKWKHKNGSAEPGCLPIPSGKNSQDVNNSCQKKMPLQVNLRVMQVEDKQKSKEAALDSMATKAKSAEVTGPALSGKSNHKDGSNWNSIGSANTKPPVSLIDSQYDSCGSGLQKEKESPSSDHSSHGTTTTAGCTSLADVKLSPSKALRAALLKSRFAETIFKANLKGDKANPLKLQQERERLQKQTLAEKARIEEEIKMAEAASRMKLEAELKIRREREREAARIALEKMERTVEFEDNLKTLKELEKLSYGCVERFPLERLGLYIKDDFLEEDIQF